MDHRSASPDFYFCGPPYIGYRFIQKWYKLETYYLLFDFISPLLKIESTRIKNRFFSTKDWAWQLTHFILYSHYHDSELHQQWSQASQVSTTELVHHKLSPLHYCIKIYHHHSLVYHYITSASYQHCTVVLINNCVSQVITTVLVY